MLPTRWLQTGRRSARPRWNAARRASRTRQLRVGDERQREADTLRLSAGQLLRGLAGDPGDPGDLEHLVDVQRSREECRHHRHQLPDGEVPEQRARLQHRPDLARPDDGGRLLAEHRDRAGVGLGQSEQHVDRRRLAGTVRPEERDRLPGSDGDVDAADCRNDRVARTVRLRETAKLDSRRRVPLRPRGRFRPRCAQEPPSVPCLPNECQAPAGIGLSPGSAFVKAVLPSALDARRAARDRVRGDAPTRARPRAPRAPRVRLDASSTRRRQPVRAAVGGPGPGAPRRARRGAAADHQRRRRPAHTERPARDLYEALLGYTYVDSCGEQLAHLGQPSPRELDASTRLHEACAHLRHASALFTRAVTLERSSLLVSAASEALGTAPLLRRARSSLTRLR